MKKRTTVAIALGLVAMAAALGYSQGSPVNQSNVAGVGSTAGGTSYCTDNWSPGAISQTFVAGHTYCPNAVGTYTFAPAANVNVSNVSIYCSNKGMVLQRTGATDGFDLSGNFDYIIGCTLDGNGQTAAGTGPLVKMTGNDDDVFDVQFQNTGNTNPVSSTVDITGGGTRDKLRYSTFSGTQTDMAFGTDTENSGAVGISNDYEFTGNYVPNCNLGLASITACAWVQAPSTTPPRGLFLNNIIIGAGQNSSALVFIQGQSTHVQGNSIIANGRTGVGLDFHGSGGNGNIISDNYIQTAGQINSGDALIADTYNSVISHITIDSNGTNPAFEMADSGSDNVSEIAINGVTGNGGFLINSVGQNAADNVVTNVTVNETGGGPCFEVTTNSATANLTNANRFSDVKCIGNSTTGSIGFQINSTGSGAAITNTIVSNSSFTGVVTGIQERHDAGATASSGTKLLDNVFVTVTTPYTLDGVTFIHDLITGMTFANRPTDADVANGSMLFLSDATVANPCAGAGTGAIDKRLNGVNVCN